MRQIIWFLALEKSTNFPWITWASECTMRYRSPTPRASGSLCCSDTRWVLVVRMLLTTSPLEPSCMPLLTAWTAPAPFLTRKQLTFPHQTSAKQPSSKRPLLPKQVQPTAPNTGSYTACPTVLTASLPLKIYSDCLLFLMEQNVGG